MGIALAVLRGIFSKTGLKFLGIAIVLAIIGGFLHHEYSVFYQRIFDAGVAQQAKVTDQWKTKTAQAQAQSVKDKAQLQTYVASYNKYVHDTKLQQAALVAKQQVIVADLKAKIAGINHQLASAKRLNSEINNYISPANDVSCIIPTGMLLLYNQSLQDSTPAGGFLTPRPSYAFAPSGVSCRTFASYLVLNNAAAVQYRSLLIQWQVWYTSNVKIFKTYLQEHQATAPPSSTLPAS